MSFSQALPCLLRRPLFLDMKHSNNAARVRLWLRHNPHVPVDTQMITYADLATPAYAKICPTRKCPAYLEPVDGKQNNVCLFESAVILDYLEYKYNNNAAFVPSDPLERAKMDLITRMHDLYVASPNSTMPGMSHSQGSMYLAPVLGACTHALLCPGTMHGSRYARQENSRIVGNNCSFWTRPWRAVPTWSAIN